jgi:hypothetical protein
VAADAGATPVVFQTWPTLLTDVIADLLPGTITPSVCGPRWRRRVPFPRTWRIAAARAGYSVTSASYAPVPRSSRATPTDGNGDNSAPHNERGAATGCGTRYVSNT